MNSSSRGNANGVSESANHLGVRSRNSSGNSSASASASAPGLRGTPIPLTPQSLQATEYLSTLSALGHPLPPSLNPSAFLPPYSASTSSVSPGVSLPSPASADWNNPSSTLMAAWWQQVAAASNASSLSQRLQQHGNSGFGVPSPSSVNNLPTSLGSQMQPHPLQAINPLLGINPLHNQQLAAAQYAAAAQYMAALQEQAALTANFGVGKNPLFAPPSLGVDWSSANPASSASFEEVFQKTKELLHSNTSKLKESGSSKEQGSSKRSERPFEDAAYSRGSDGVSASIAATKHSRTSSSLSTMAASSSITHTTHSITKTVSSTTVAKLHSTVGNFPGLHSERKSFPEFSSSIYKKPSLDSTANSKETRHHASPFAQHSALHGLAGHKSDHNEEYQSHGLFSAPSHDAAKSPIKTAGTFLPPVCQNPQNRSISKGSTPSKDGKNPLHQTSKPHHPKHSNFAPGGKSELAKSLLMQHHYYSSASQLGNKKINLWNPENESKNIKAPEDLNKAMGDQPLDLCIAKRDSSESAEDLSIKNSALEKEKQARVLVLPPAQRKPVGPPSEMQGLAPPISGGPKNVPFGGLGYIYPVTSQNSSRNSKHKRINRKSAASPTGSTSSSSSSSSMTQSQRQQKTGSSKLKKGQHKPFSLADPLANSKHGKLRVISSPVPHFPHDFPKPENEMNYQQLAASLMQMEHSKLNHSSQTAQTAAHATAALLAAAASKNLSDQSYDPKWNLLQDIIQNHLKTNSKSSSKSETDLSKSTYTTSNSCNNVNDNCTSFSDTEDDETGSEADTIHPREGLNDSDDVLPNVKQKRIFVDEKLLNVPLQKGWKRECLLTSIAKNGIVKGEVNYITPCGNKLVSYSDLMKFLSHVNSPDLGRDNFSFSARNLLGEYFVDTQNNEVCSMLKLENSKTLYSQTDGRKFYSLKGNEIKVKIIELTNGRGRYGKRLLKSVLSSSHMRSHLNNMEPEINSKNSYYSENVTPFNKNQLSCMQTENQTEEKSHEIPQSFMHSFQQHLQKMKANPEMKSPALDQSYQLTQHLQSLQQQAQEEKERQRRQELMLKIQEREKKRKEILILKSIEIRRKQEEKDKMRVDRRRIETQSKMLKLKLRGLENELAHELNMLKEDMVLVSQARSQKHLGGGYYSSTAENISNHELPELERIQGLKLSGEAFSDMLMIIEFLNNFSDVLGLLPNNIIGMKTFQKGLFYEDIECADEIDNLLMHLLQVAMDEPGLPNPREAVTILGQRITEVPLDDISMSEISRIFIKIRNAHKDNDVTKALQKQPFQAMTPELKLQTLSFLCNELLINKNIVKHIDNSLDVMANCRKEKWLLENDYKKFSKIKRMKFAKEEREGFDEEEEEESEDDNALLDDEYEEVDGFIEDEDGFKTRKKQKKKRKDFDDEDLDLEDSSSASKTIITPQRKSHTNFDNFGISNIPIEEDEAFQWDQDQLEKRIGRTEKQLAKNSAKLFATAKSVRGLDLGMDRYKRRYWALSHCGGVFVQASSKDEDEIEGIIKNINGDENKEIEVKNLEQMWDDETSVIDPDSSYLTQESEDVETGWFSLSESTPCLIKSSNVQNCTLSPPCTTVGTADSELEENADISLAMSTKDSNFLKPDWWRSTTDYFDFLAPEALSYSREEQEETLEIEETKVAIEKKKEALVQLRQAKALDIPKENQEGWWIIRQPESIKKLLENTFSSGMRENPLQKNLEIFYEHHIELCTKSKYRQTLDFEPSSGPWEDGIRKCFPKKRKLEDIENGTCKRSRKFYYESDTDPACFYSPALSHQMEVQLLHEVEALEERIFAANIQISDLKAMTSLTAEIWKDGSKQKAISENKTEVVAETVTRENPSQILEKAMKNDIPPSCDIRKASMNLIMKIENPLEKAKEKLLLLERCIERRYLKPPLRKNMELTVHNVYMMSHENMVCINGDDKNKDENGSETNSGQNTPGSKASKHEDEEEELEEGETRGLRRWRNATVAAESVSQVGLCLNQLTQCIAWEKSIMRASCQLCHLDDNEAQLLLCDSCDKGFHTYCFKPSLENIPEGNWYCFICIGKAMGEVVCVVCGRKSTLHLLRCDMCLLSFHGDCLEPPVTKAPRGRWYCSHCAQVFKCSPSKKSKKLTTHSEILEDTFYEDNSDVVINRSSARYSRETLDLGDSSSQKISLQVEKVEDVQTTNLTRCKDLLQELKTHEDGWPFLEPVNVKVFPQYKKIIKKAMDFSLIQKKLLENTYNTHASFAADVLLVFENCLTFNEDNSDVGKAGKSLDTFFKQRWKEIFDEDVNNIYSGNP